MRGESSLMNRSSRLVRTARRASDDRAGEEPLYACGARNAQLHLGSRIEPAPDRELAARELRALPHPAQPEMPFASLRAQHRPGRCPCRRRAPAAEGAARRSAARLRSASHRRGGRRCAAPRRRCGRPRRARSDAAPAACPAPRCCSDASSRFSLASSSASARRESARSFVSVAEVRNPCTASRPSVIASAAWSMALARTCFDSAGRSGRRLNAVWNRSSSP